MTVTWDYTDLAPHYDKRPDYSATVIDELLELAGAGPATEAADIGAGTGKLTKLLLGRGLVVDAVEPNERMRAMGVRNTQGSRVTWHAGTGEQTGLPSSRYGLATYGSSFNVMDRREALREAARILQPGGWFACLWNHRDLDDPVQREVEGLIRKHVKDYDYGTRRADQAEVIEASGLFGAVHKIEGKIQHTLPVSDYVDAWRSHATLQRQAGEAFPQIVGEIAAALGDRESLTVPYTTRMFCAPVRSRAVIGLHAGRFGLRESDAAGRVPPASA